MVVVTEEFCNACGTPRVKIHHQCFPEMWVSGEFSDQAVDELATHLEANLAAVSDPLHRAPVQLAIADVQAFIDETPFVSLNSAKLLTCAPPAPPNRVHRRARS
jgi:hypothetical protein